MGGAGSAMLVELVVHSEAMAVMVAQVAQGGMEAAGPEAGCSMMPRLPLGERNCTASAPHMQQQCPRSSARAHLGKVGYT